MGEAVTARTKQRDNLYIERMRTNLGGRDFRTKGPLVWNQLPTEIKSTQNSSNLKTHKKLSIGTAEFIIKYNSMYMDIM